MQEKKKQRGGLIWRKLESSQGEWDMVLPTIFTSLDSQVPIAKEKYQILSGFLYTLDIDTLLLSDNEFGNLMLRHKQAGKKATNLARVIWFWLAGGTSLPLLLNTSRN